MSAGGGEMSDPLSGKMPWAQALAGPLDGVTCHWQDLDGLHVESAPVDPPPTSVLWGWRGDSYLVRARIGGGTAFVAVQDAPGTASAGLDGSPALPWAAGDDRIAASHGRGPAAQAGGVGATYEQIVIDGIGDGAGPVTFLRPARVPGNGQSPDRHA